MAVRAALLLALGLAGCSSGTARGGPDAPAPAARRHVLAAVDRLFEAINAGEGSLVRGVVAADAHVAMLGPEGRLLGRGGLETMVDGATEAWVERIWDAEVRVHGDAASVWAPYDFYRGDRFSHCGVDALLLERREGTWWIVSLVWVREQPPACALHPQGPPGRGGR